MGFWESVQYRIWKIEEFFGNEDAGIHAESLKAVTEAKTPTDRLINDTVNAEEIVGPRIPIFSDLTDALQGGIKGLGSILKNLPLYLLLALVFVGIYLILMGKRGKAVI